MWPVSFPAVAIDTAIDCRFKRDLGLSICAKCNDASGSLFAWRVKPPGEGGFARCRECSPVFFCQIAPPDSAEKAYAIDGTCLTTESSVAKVQQLTRDPGPLIEIADLNPMVAAALHETWISENGVNPITLARFNVSFDTQFTAREIRDALLSGRYGGSPIVGDRSILASSELQSAAVDTKHVYRIRTFYESRDGTRTPSGPAVDVTTEWASFVPKYDEPAKMSFDIQLFRITGWSEVKN